MNMLMELKQAIITAQAASTSQNGGPGISAIIPFILIMIMFYFLMIRPQQKRQKELQKMIEGVKTGDKVVAAGGIYGIVSNVKDKSIILKVADGVKIEVDRQSIASVSKDTEASATA